MSPNHLTKNQKTANIILILSIPFIWCLVLNMMLAPPHPGSASEESKKRIKNGRNKPANPQSF